jgi:hypothetical protein
MGRNDGSGDLSGTCPRYPTAVRRVHAGHGTIPCGDGARGEGRAGHAVSVITHCTSLCLWVAFALSPAQPTMKNVLLVLVGVAAVLAPFAIASKCPSTAFPVICESTPFDLNSYLGCVPVCLRVCVCLCVSVFVCMCVCVCLTHSLCLSQTLSLSHTHTHSLSLSLSLCLSLSLSLSLVHLYGRSCLSCLCSLSCAACGTLSARASRSFSAQAASARPPTTLSVLMAP